MRATFMALTWDCERQSRALTVPPQGHYSGYQVVVVSRREQQRREFMRLERRSARVDVFRSLFEQCRALVEVDHFDFKHLAEIPAASGTVPTRSAHSPVMRKGLRRSDFCRDATQHRHSTRRVFDDGRMPESQVTIDNVARDMIRILEDAVKIRADLIISYREYRSDDLTAPCYGPVEFKMRKVTLSATTLIGTARLDDLANRKFPARVYTTNEFPGLLA